VVDGRDYMHMGFYGCLFSSEVGGLQHPMGLERLDFGRRFGGDGPRLVANR